MKSAALVTNDKNTSSFTIEPVDADLTAHINPAIGYLASLRTEQGRRVQTQALATVAKLLRSSLADCDHQTAIAGIQWQILNNSFLKAVSSKLATMHSPKTANRKLDAVRGVLRQAWLNGLMTRDEYERAVAVPRIPGSRLLRGRDVSSGEMLALFLNCRNDQSIVGRRDAAMLALLFGAGLRRAEAADLTVADWKPETKEIIVQRGKGNKSRKIPLPDGTVKALDAWLAARGEYSEADALLCPLRKGGKVENKPMSTQGIWKSLIKRALKAGIASLSPHDARRTFIGDLLETGADLSLTATLAGHSDPKQTKGYDRRGDEVKRAAVARLNIPFV